MTYLILTVPTFCFLVAASYYYHSFNLKNLQAKTESDKQVKLFLLAPVVLTVINIILLKFNSSIELLIVVLFLWLNIIFFFLWLIKFFSATKAILLATLISQTLISIVYLINSEYLNNLLLILAFTAAVSLIYKRLKISNKIWISMFIIMAALDAVFVWLVPVVPAAEYRVQPLIFSLLIKVGDISLGAGDIVFLLLAVFILTKHFSLKVVFGQALILSLALPIALLVQNLVADSMASFPFLVVLTPLFLITFWLTEIINIGKKPHKNSLTLP